MQEVVEVGRRGGEGRAAHMSGMDEKKKPDSAVDAVVAWFGRVERVADAAAGAGKALGRAARAWAWLWLPVGAVVWSVCTGEPVGVPGLVELLGALRSGG